MSESELSRSVWPRFSLLHLLTLTALIAIALAVAMVYRKNRSMVQYHDELLSLSSRLRNVSDGTLASSAMPRVADDFHSWHVHIPEGNDYELRLGIGAVSEAGIPPVVGAVPILAGQHRVTLHTADSPDEDFRYVVYVDGKSVIENTMGSDWIPGGWSSASGLNWPRGQKLDPAPHQLVSQSYRTRPDLGSGNYFNGRSDNFVTRRGYRLWIDPRDRTWEPASPFIGFANDVRYNGIGLRDGLRYQSDNLSSYHWTFTRPQLDTRDPAWTIAAEFFAEDGVSLTDQTESFQSWQLRNDARGENALRWQADPRQSVYTAFLCAKHRSDDGLRPVVQLQWDASRPDEVGLRIADTPANDRIRRWRIRILDGTQHLWRQLQIGDRLIHAGKLAEDGETKSSDATFTLDPNDSTTADIRVEWQTDEALPLQVVERKNNGYAGMDLFQGLPVTCGIQLPASLKPTLEASTLAENPSIPSRHIPGGAVFDELKIDLDATNHDWIWLKTQSKSADAGEGHR